MTTLLGARPSATECITSLEEPRVCGALKAADTVFLADVEAVQAVPGSGRTDVSFRIIEAFKGAKVGVRTLRLISAIGSHPFAPGQRALVYASTDDGANNHPGLRVTLRSHPGDSCRPWPPTAAGHFVFDWLAPGGYSLEVDGGTSFFNEQRPLVVGGRRACVTMPAIVLRRRT